jgi:hypothetical protein
LFSAGQPTADLFPFRLNSYRCSLIACHAKDGAESCPLSCSKPSPPTSPSPISSATEPASGQASPIGDSALIYHTGDAKAIVGLAKVTKSAYEDPAQPGLNDEAKPKAPVVDLAPVKAAKSPVTLAAIKADKRFADFALVKSSRLSVMPVPADLDKILRTLAGL